MKKNLSTDSGFTLLFASLIVSLILSIALAIAHITLSQIILSSAGKESQVAFYNADAGIECALYYEYNVRGSDGGPAFPKDASSQPPSITCNGFSASDLSTTYNGATTSTTFSINPPGQTCVGDNMVKPSYLVKVDKRVRDVYSSYVYVESRGYNTCDSNNPKRVERGLYASFID